MATTRKKSTFTPAVEVIKKTSPVIPNQEHLIVAFGLVDNALSGTPLTRTVHLAQAFATLGLEEPTVLTAELIHLYLEGEHIQEEVQEADSRLYKMEKLRRKLTDLRYSLSPFQNQEGMDAEQGTWLWAWLWAWHDLVTAACLLCSQLAFTSGGQQKLADAYTEEVTTVLTRACSHLRALAE